MAAALSKRTMRFPKAVIFDIYRTVLDVTAAPAAAELRWERLWMQLGPFSTMPTLDDVSDRCRKIVAQDHAAAREQGILWLKVVWPEVISRAIPEFSGLDLVTRDRWVFDHQACLRSLKIAPGAVEVLSALRDAGVPMEKWGQCGMALT
jgi:FMN phosphatase YigB (HAD superfamily)